jgi:hypothetical protein
MNQMNLFYKKASYYKPDIFVFLQLLLAFLFLYYSYTEGNKFYCLITGRKGLFYVIEDLIKLICFSHRETTETTVLQYVYQLLAIMGEKVVEKLHQHFVLCTTSLAQKAVLKYTENILGICAPNIQYHSATVHGNGWYGYMESMIRLVVRPTEMGYCFLDSNRLFNSFLVVEMEKYFLQCKISLITMSSTGVIGITMGFRSLFHFYLPFPGLAIDRYEQTEKPEKILFSETVVKSKRKRRKEK